LADALELDGARRGDRDCRAGGKRFQEPLVIGGERRPAFEPVDCDQHPVALAAEDQRHDQTCRSVKAESAEAETLEPGAVRLVFQAECP